MQSNDDQTVKLSDGALNFPINPPINDSVMECIITVCYLDSQWYDPYLITHRPTFQPQQDCLASGPDVIMSHSTVIDYSSSNIAIMMEQQEFFSSGNSLTIKIVLVIPNTYMPVPVRYFQDIQLTR